MRALIILAMLLPSAASAQAPCADYAEITETLAGQWGESAAGRGLANTGLIMEVLTNPETGSWTVLMISPDGTACAVAAGDAWADVPPAPDA